jgi:predicted Fe-Mo cluster-binding NifX family protein
MNIAVAGEDQNLESVVSEKFIACRYLVIVNMNNMEFISFENKDDQLGEALVRKITACRCEAVITGIMTPYVFDILAGNGVTRYDGRGYTVKEAISLMDRHGLKLIRNLQGTDNCDHNHDNANIKM